MRCQEVEEGHAGGRPHPEAPRTANKVRKRAARSVHRLHERHLIAHHLSVVELLAQEAGHAVVDEHPGHAERSECDKGKIKECEICVRHSRLAFKDDHCHHQKANIKKEENNIPKVLISDADHKRPRLPCTHPHQKNEHERCGDHCHKAKEELIKILVEQFHNGIGYSIANKKAVQHPCPALS